MIIKEGINETERLSGRCWMEDMVSLLLNSIVAIGISRIKVMGSCKEEILCAGIAIKQPLLIRK